MCPSFVVCDRQIERADKEREARKKDPQDDGVEYIDFDGGPFCFFCLSILCRLSLPSLSGGAPRFFSVLDTPSRQYLSPCPLDPGDATNVLCTRCVLAVGSIDVYPFRPSSLPMPCACAGCPLGDFCGRLASVGNRCLKGRIVGLKLIGKLGGPRFFLARVLEVDANVFQRVRPH